MPNYSAIALKWSPNKLTRFIVGHLRDLTSNNPTVEELFINCRLNSNLKEEPDESTSYVVLCVMQGLVSSGRCTSEAMNALWLAHIQAGKQFQLLQNSLINTDQLGRKF